MRERIFADPNCSKCDGTGVYYPSDDAVGVVMCDCGKKVQVIRLTDQAGFPDNYVNKRVNDYKAEAGNVDEETTRRRIVEWITGYKPGCRGLLLLGPKGTGKTHLLVGIGKAVINTRQAPVMYVSASSFVRETKARFTMPNEDDEKDTVRSSAESYFEDAAEKQVLLLDDLGAEYQTAWSVAQICDLVDARYSNGRTTLIASNFTMAEIENTYGERMADRLYEMCERLKCYGQSRRRGGEDAA